MKQFRNRFWIKPLLSGLLAGCGLSLVAGVQAQDDGYSVRENGASRKEFTDNPVASKENAGPVRLARFSYLSGDVTWRGDDAGEWSAASQNLPMRQGAQIWVAKGGRAEIQFDDGSLLRLGSNSVATLQTLFSDSEGEFTEIKLTDGIAALRLKHDRDIYQVDTPFVSVKATGPAKIRVGVGDGVEVGVREGKVNIEGDQGTTTLQKGDYLDLQDSSSSYDPRRLPKGDTWERWNDERDQNLERASESYRINSLPENIAQSAGDLDSYGTWRNDNQYGHVWCPTVSRTNWRPYHDGRWTWVSPFGWTWVSDEAWGWAPYHYGTWVNLSYGWAWVPGPAQQYWSPAVVSFSEYDGNIAWCPLAPLEVRYPSYISFGYYGRNWYNRYSIGQAACYYPTNYGYCSPVVYNTTIINRVTIINNHTTIINRSPSAFGRYQSTAESDAIQSNRYVNKSFVPVNSGRGAVTTADSKTFGGRGSYTAAGDRGSAMFQRGRVIAAPQANSNRTLTAGPATIRPVAESFTPRRSYTANVIPTARQEREVYRAPLTPKIERTTSPVNAGRNGAAGRLNGSLNGTGDTPARTNGGRTARENGGSGNATVDTRRTAEQPVRTRKDPKAPSIGRETAPNEERSAAQKARESLGLGGRSRPSDSSSNGSSDNGNRTGRTATPETRRSANPGNSTETPPTRRRTGDTPTRGDSPRSNPSDQPRTYQPRSENPAPTRQPEPRRESPPPSRQPDPVRQPEPRQEPRRESPPPSRQPEPTRQADPPARGSDSDKDKTGNTTNPTNSRGRRP